MAGTLKMYKEATLDTQVSIEGSFGEPDSVASLDGATGETDETPYWIAPEQGVLAADMDSSQTTLTLSAPRFADFAILPIVIIGTEKIHLGVTTDNLIFTGCVRNYAGTTAASHTTGDRVYSGYDNTGVSIDCRDNEQVVSGDESGYVTYADDVAGSPGTYEAPHALNSLAHNESQKIWRKVVIPAGTSPQRKTDLIHDIDHEAGEATI